MINNIALSLERVETMKARILTNTVIEYFKLRTTG